MPTLLGLPATVRDHSSPSARLAWLTLREADDPLTTTTLAVETGTSVDRIRRVLGTLEEADLVESRDCPADRRRTLWTSNRAAPSNRGLTAGGDPENRAEDARLSGLSASNPRGDR